ncbi:M16 family metallopeptidase [Plantactinospora sp. WMMB334]|uniref:M16 family metallopeptidase n=1 Tax=Plantactinospora sp. WMMB334 TaxID=3404119 RepID=UPI003B956FDD
MIRELDVDGVPALVAPTTGPMHAGLMFRVGQADETLARRGVTHLLEHLVLHPLGVADYHYNGTTGTSVTHFHMQGSAADIVTFLGGVCAALRQPAGTRLETEKAILRTEWSGRSNPAVAAMPLWRHGARDYGLVSYPEWGIEAVRLEDLHEWSARYFTRENAVLWLAGEDLPPGLALDLPAGRRHPAPTASSALPRTPAFFRGGSQATGFQAVVPRQTAATVLTGVLERKLFRALRQEGGLSYTAAADYEPRGDGFAVLTALADALPEKQDAVLGGFVDVLAELRVGRIDDAEVSAVVSKATEALGTAEADAARLPVAAFNLLTGYPVDSSDALVWKLKAVTVEQVHGVARAALDSALLMIPAGRTADWAGFVAAPIASDEVVSGTAYRGLGDPTEQLVIGAEGVSLVSGGGPAATVRFDRCAVMLDWPDGGRLLIGDDGISVRVEPTLYRGADDVRVDSRVPAGSRVSLPAREPDEIPRPAPPGRAGASRRSRRPTRRHVRIGVLGLITLGMGALALVVSIGIVIGEVDASPLGAIGGWMIAGYLGRGLWKAWHGNE